MAGQQKTQKKITEKKVKADMEKTTEPTSGEIVLPPAAPVSATPTKKSMKKGKLLPKNKHRLPRRLKKARQKAATRL